MKKTFRIATRESNLALAQANQVGKALVAADPEVSYELVKLKTTGDKFLGDLNKVGGKGVFTKEIEEALLDGRADIAMHSMKDVPAVMHEDLIIPAILKRDDIRDVVVGLGLSELEAGQKVGTSSSRRGSQIKATFPDLEIVPFRGNVETRIAKLNKGEADAILLAKAGLDRLGLQDKIKEVLEPDIMMPALGQGAVGIQCRKDDKETLEFLKKVNDRDTLVCLTAERELVKVLEADCHSPIAGFCEVTKGGNLRFMAMVVSPDGKVVLRARHKMGYDEAHELGKTVAEDLLDQGAAKYINKA